MESAVGFLTEAGLPYSKIILGIPTYGRATSEKESASPETSSVYYYNELPLPGSKMFIDRGTAAAYCIKDGEFISYDNEETVEIKCQWVKQHGLGGVIFWDLAGDRYKDKRQGLLDSAWDVLGSRVQKRANHITYPHSCYTNITNEP